MLKKLLLLSVFVTGLFSLQVCAQGGQVNKLNYMMGTVSIPMSIKTNVLATPTATSCAPLLTSFHKYGDEGESVVKLQRF
jgi:formylmethanofuran dehydrogenase subunit D